MFFELSFRFFFGPRITLCGTPLNWPCGPHHIVLMFSKENPFDWFDKPMLYFVCDLLSYIFFTFPRHIILIFSRENPFDWFEAYDVFFMWFFPDPIISLWSVPRCCMNRWNKKILRTWLIDTFMIDIFYNYLAFFF